MTGTAGKENGTNGDGWKIDWTPENRTNSPFVSSPFVSMPYEKPSIYQQGWVCPKCGAVMSPTTNECPHCRPKDTFTC